MSTSSVQQRHRSCSHECHGLHRPTVRSFPKACFLCGQPSMAMSFATCTSGIHLSMGSYFSWARAYRQACSSFPEKIPRLRRSRHAWTSSRIAPKRSRYIQNAMHQEYGMGNVAKNFAFCTNKGEESPPVKKQSKIFRGRRKKQVSSEDKEPPWQSLL